MLCSVALNGMYMKLIIAGSRDISLTNLSMYHFVNYFFDYRNPSEVVSGGAKGVDTYGEEFAANRGIPIKRFEADWYSHGKAAGPMRNKQMAKYADRLLLVWDGESRGSANMKEEMLKLGKPVHEVVLRTHNDS